MSRDKKVLLSVIIPVYNRMEYIDKCMESVMNQTYKNIEIILVDDGSTDGSGEICDRYAKKDVRIIVVHQKNGGQMSARKSGVEKAGGEVATFVDSDDWIEPDMYERMMATYMDGKPDMVTSGLICEYGEWKNIWLDGVEAGIYEKDAIRHEIFPCLMYDENTKRQGITPSLCNKLLKTPMLKKIMDMADTQLTLGEDGVIVYDFAGQADKIAILHNAWYHYVQHEGSMVHAYNLCSFEKIYRLKKNFLNIVEKLGIEKEMKVQINWSVKNFLKGAIKNIFEIDMNGISWIFPYECVPKGSKIILYGAGDVGHSYWKCIRHGGYVELTAWVDRRHDELREAGLPVESIDSAICKEYDYVVIAIQEKERAEKIRSFLLEYGVMGDRIIWKQNQEII